MSTNEKVNPINWELALHDVMHIVCKHSSIKELKNLARVNKTWRNAALRELSKTFYIQMLRFPYRFGDPSKLKRSFLHARKRFCFSIICYLECLFKRFSRCNVMSPDTQPLASMIYQKPYVSMMFYDWRLKRSCIYDEGALRNIVLDDSKDFCKDLPNNVLLFEVAECITAEDVEPWGMYGDRKILQTGNQDLVGLFFPNVERRARVRAVWHSEMFPTENASDKVRYLGEELGLNDCQCTKSTILWFIKPYTTAQRLVCETEKMYYKGNQNTVTWIGELADANIVAISESKGRGPILPVIAGLRISGPGVESWTAKIDLYLPWETIENELRALKERLVIKRHCTGLLSAPSNSLYGSGSKIMRKINRIFCGMPFVGLFDGHIHSVYVRDLPEDSLQLRNSEIGFMISRYQHMSIIIITYD